MQYGHDRVNIENVSASCGLVCLSRLSDEAEENLFVVANGFYHPARGNPPAFVLWSNTAKPTLLTAEQETSGHEFAALVRDFGKVLETDKEINPKTGNPIRVWIWQVNHEKLKAWYKQRKIDLLKRA